MQTHKAFDVQGLWVRWSRYELLNGVVFPAAGAELVEYDPWKSYRANVGKYRTVEQPYVDLLELNRALEGLKGRGIQPSYFDSADPEESPIAGPQNEADVVVLDWCNHHGLLGLASVLSTSMRFYPITSLGGTMTAKRHFREGGYWRSVTHCTEEAKLFDQLEEESRPGVDWFNASLGECQPKSLDHIREFFLPQVRPIPNADEDVFQPPCPNTREFWHCYGEPVTEIAAWCELLTLGVRHSSSLLGWQKRGLEQGHGSWEQVSLSPLRDSARAEGLVMLVTLPDDIREQLQAASSSEATRDAIMQAVLDHGIKMGEVGSSGATDEMDSLQKKGVRPLDNVLSERTADRAAAEEYYWMLAGLTQAAAPAFVFNSKRNLLEEVRVSAGLLASYSLMFLWDLMDGRRAICCDNCNSFFVSDDLRASYCSPTCRNTASSRRFRNKKRAIRTEISRGE